MIKIEAAGRSEGRDRDRLKGNGETESFKRTELATNRQKTKIVAGRFFLGEKVGKKSVVVVFFVFLAVGGHPPTRPFWPFQTLRFAITFQKTVPIPSLTSPCSDGGGAAAAAAPISDLFNLSVSPVPFKRSLSRPSLRPAAPISPNFSDFQFWKIKVLLQ